jgi:cytochrome c
MLKSMKMLALATAGLMIAGNAMAADCDVAKGEKQFRKCKACHKLEAGAKAVGPDLFGIVGRKIASADGFNYSSGMMEYAGGDAVWDAARLDAYLKKPKDEVPGTKMAFAGVKKEDQRADLICYLETIK